MHNFVKFTININYVSSIESKSSNKVIKSGISTKKVFVNALVYIDLRCFTKKARACTIGRIDETIAVRG